MKKTISIFLAVFALFAMLCAGSLYMKPVSADSALKQDVLKYIEENKQAIQEAISNQFGDIIQVDQIKGIVGDYVEENEEKINAFIEKLKSGNESFEDKTKMISDYLFNTLYTVVDTIQPGCAFYVQASIRSFADEYGAEVADQYKSWLASMISDGSLFFILAIVIEAGVIVFLIVKNVKIKRGSKESVASNE